MWNMNFPIHSQSWLISALSYNPSACTEVKHAMIQDCRYGPVFTLLPKWATHVAFAAPVCRTRSLACSSRVFLLRLLPRLVLMDLSGRWYARRKCYCLFFFFLHTHPAAVPYMSYHPKKKLPGFDYCQLLWVGSKYRWESEQTLLITFYFDRPMAHDN
jgi:hypothetical protein